jgi:hypothetical protein
MRSVQTEQIIFRAASATGTGTPQMVEDYQHLLLTLSSANSANFTIQIQGSQADTCPTFSSSASVTNPWSYVQVKNYNDNSTVNGNVGIVYAGTDAVGMYEVNTNGLRWICATITVYSAGNITLNLKTYSNE